MEKVNVIIKSIFLAWTDEISSMLRVAMISKTESSMVSVRLLLTELLTIVFL